jgi:hypothetical protein
MSWKKCVVLLLPFATVACFSLAGLSSTSEIQFRTSFAKSLHFTNLSNTSVRTARAVSARPFSHAAVTNRIGKLPLTFEPSAGQTGATFIGRGMGLTVLLTPDEMKIQVPQRSHSLANPSLKMRWRRASSGKTTLIGEARKSFRERPTI